MHFLAKKKFRVKSVFEIGRKHSEPVSSNFFTIFSMPHDIGTELTFLNVKHSIKISSLVGFLKIKWTIFPFKFIGRLVLTEQKLERRTNIEKFPPATDGLRAKNEKNNKKANHKFQYMFFSNILDVLLGNISDEHNEKLKRLQICIGGLTR